SHPQGRTGLVSLPAGHEGLDHEGPPFLGAVGRPGPCSALVPEMPCKTGRGVVKKIRLLWVSCDDSDSLLNANKGFHASLEQQKVLHTRYLETGGHTIAAMRHDLQRAAHTAPE